MTTGMPRFSKHPTLFATSRLSVFSEIPQLSCAVACLHAQGQELLLFLLAGSKNCNKEEKLQSSTRMKEFAENAEIFNLN